MGRAEKAVKNAFFGVICKMLNVLIIFCTRTVFIYILGEEYLGISGLFTSILSMLSLVELGFAEAMAFALYVPIANKDTNKISVIMRYFKKIYFVIGILVLALGLSITPWIGSFVREVPNINENIQLIYVLYVVNSAISYLYVYKSTILEANQEKYLISLINILTTFVKAIIECIILFVSKNFIAYLIIEILGTALYNIVISIVSQKKYAQELSKTNEVLTNDDKRAIRKNVKALFFYKVCNVVLTSTDNLIINAYVSTIAVGLYSNYTLIINQLYIFFLQIINPVIAGLGNFAVTESKEKQYDVFKKLVFLCFVIYCITSTIFITLVNQFIELWIGGNYLLPFSTVCIITINYYLTGLLTVINYFRTANGLFIQGQYRPIIMTALNILISVLLVKAWGISGVVLGTILSRLLTQFWYDPNLVYKKLFHVKLTHYFYINGKYFFITVVCCLLCYQINSYLRYDGFFGLVINAMIALMIPVIIILLLFRNTTEFKYYVNLVHLKRNKTKLKPSDS